MNEKESPEMPGIEEIRAYLRSEVAKSSLRKAAADIGLGHSTLHNFLDGIDPHQRVRGVLAEWYLRRLGRGWAEERKAIRCLIGGLPSAAWPEATAELLDCLQARYERRGQAVPGWIGQIRGEM